MLTDASVEFPTSENLFNTKLFNWESSVVKRRIFSKTDEVLTGLLFNRAEYHFESAYLNFKPSSRGLREHFHEPSNGLFQLLMPLHSVSGLVPRFYFFFLFFSSQFPFSRFLFPSSFFCKAFARVQAFKDL